MYSYNIYNWFATNKSFENKNFLTYSFLRVQNSEVHFLNCVFRIWELMGIGEGWFSHRLVTSPKIETVITDDAGILISTIIAIHLFSFYIRTGYFSQGCRFNSRLGGGGECRRKFQTSLPIENKVYKRAKICRQG